jgi:putative photosynthetic complex assembly protein
MSDAFGTSALPRGVLAGAGLLLGLALITTVGARVSGIGTTRMPGAQTVTVVELRFLDRADGAVVVQQAADGHVIEVLPPGTNGFARGVLRGLARDRRLQHLGAGPPFRLVRWSDGRLSLEDPATGRHVNLEAFGPTNAQVFADLLVASRQPPAQE